MMPILCLLTYQIDSVAQFLLLCRYVDDAFLVILLFSDLIWVFYTFLLDMRRLCTHWSEHCRLTIDIRLASIWPQWMPVFLKRLSLIHSLCHILDLLNLLWILQALSNQILLPATLALISKEWSTTRTWTYWGRHKRFSCEYGILAWLDATSIGGF